MKLKIEYKNIDELVPYEKNPRINKEAIKYVKNSIKQFGFKNPVIIDKNNVIVCGHTRVDACKELKINEIPCIYADDLTDEQIKAFRLADNKVGEFAEWDFSLLDEELSDIIDLDMSDLGSLNDEDIELDIEHETKENAESIETQHYLVCGQYKIPIDAEEQKLFSDKVEEYLNDYGTVYGFVRKVFQ